MEKKYLLDIALVGLLIAVFIGVISSPAKDFQKIEAGKAYKIEKLCTADILGPGKEIIKIESEWSTDTCFFESYNYTEWCSKVNDDVKKKGYAYGSIRTKVIVHGKTVKTEYPCNQTSAKT